MAVGEFFVVDAEQVQERGVHVVDVHLVLLGVEAVIVGGAVGEAAFHAGTGHPHGKAPRVVVAAVHAGALHGGCAAEFTAPQHQRVVEQPTRLEVGEQSGDGFIDLGGFFGVAFFEVAVLIPLYLAVAVGNLHEAHAALGKAAGHQALPAEILGDGVVHSIKFAGGLGFAGDVLNLRHRGLHAIGELEGIDAAFEHGVGRVGKMILIELLEEIELRALLAVGPLWVFDVMHFGILGLEAGVADGRAAVVRGQECAAPVVQAAVGERGANGDEGRQVFVFRAKPVADPRAHARSHEVVRAGVQLEQRAAVGGVGAVRAVDETDVIDMPCDIGKQLADLVPALAIRLELPRRGKEVAGLGKGDLRLGKRQRFAVIALQQRLVLKSVHVRRTAFHEQENDALGPRPEMRTPSRQRILRLQHRGQRQRAEAEGGLFEHVTARGHFR